MVTEVDQDTNEITIDDQTFVMPKASGGASLMPQVGAEVTLYYEEKDGEKMITRIGQAEQPTPRPLDPSVDQGRPASAGFSFLQFSGCGTFSQGGRYNSCFHGRTTPRSHHRATINRGKGPSFGAALLMP
jgi:hypothetical protein